MTRTEIKEKLIEAGVGNLKIFGYPEVNKDNILTDEVYSAFFLEMLKDYLGKSSKEVDSVILETIREINNP